ncbi:MAG: RDD family protein [Chloroflexota bacterium]|nr:RDD family protein [Chloroflexota bacterium]
MLRDNTQYFGASVAPVVYAGFWRRFAAAIVDGILLGVVLLICDILLAVIFGSTSTNYSAMASTLNLGATIAYYVGLESGPQQATFGKRALGLIVTDMQGNRISPRRSTGRYFGKFLSTLTLLIGYLMAAFTEKKQALHDKLAGTLVVVKRP